MMKLADSLLFALCMLLGLLLVSATAGAAEIRARLSSNPVAQNESFVVEFEASAQPDGEPDFSPLEGDFRILGNTQSQNIQMINGAVKRSIRWTLNLMPRQAGSYQIPAINFGRDRSTALQIEVKPAVADAAGDGSAGGRDLFIELEALPEITYPQAQVVLRVRLFRRVDIADASLSAPQVDDPDALLKPLGESRSFQLQREGVQYQVVERRYLLSPQRSGKLLISPIEFEGRVPDPDPRRRSFGLAPFGGFSQAGKVRRVYSQPLTIEVLARPAGIGAAGWLPARQLTLSDDWGSETPVLTVGEPLTRTLAVMADGLTAAQLPTLDGALPDGLKAYPDQPLLQDTEHADGVTGIRQEKVAIIPTRAGRYTLPPITLGWWNVQQQRQEWARLPARVIEVRAAPTLPVPPAEASAPSQPIALPAASSVPETSAGVSLWLALFLAAGWLLTAVGWWYAWSRRTRFPDRQVTPVTVGNAPSALAVGCNSADPAVAADALLQWAEWRWPGSGLRSLGALASRLGQGAAVDRIHQLERVLYAAGHNEQWSGGELWALLQAAAPPEPVPVASSPIAPLYTE